MVAMATAVALKNRANGSDEDRNRHRVNRRHRNCFWRHRNSFWGHRNRPKINRRHRCRHPLSIAIGFISLVKYWYWCHFSKNATKTGMM